MSRGCINIKNYSFKARPWEELYFESLDVYDTILTKIRVSVRDNKVLRILPLWIFKVIHFIMNGLLI